MKELLIFLYTYYATYLYFTFSLIGTYAASKLIKSIKNKNLIFASVFLNFAYSIVLSKIENILIIKLFTALVWGFFAPNFCHFITEIFQALLKTEFLKKYKYGLGLFIFFMVHLLLYAPYTFNRWTSIWYATDYSLGIGSRFFVGTLLNLISPEGISKDLVYTFVMCSFVLLSAVVSWYFNQLLLKSEPKYQQVLLFLTALYLASPFCINAYLSEQNFGRLEMHCFTLMLIAVISFLKINNRCLRYTVITILSCVAMAIYQGYIFLYYPMLVLVMILKILSEKQIDKRDLCGCALNILLTSCAFLFWQFFSTVNIDTFDSFCMILNRKTDWDILCQPAKHELFQSLSEVYQCVNTSFLLNRNPRERLYLAILALLPIVICVYYFYIVAWQYKNKKHWFYNQYLYCILAYFAFLPQFLLNIDWGRWLIALGNLAFFEIFILIYFRDRGALYFLKALDNFIKKHYLFCLLLILYFAKLHGFTASNILLDTTTFFDRYF